MQDINASISYDKRLYSQDIAGSKAHASMLASTTSSQMMIAPPSTKVLIILVAKLRLDNLPFLSR